MCITPRQSAELESALSAGELIRDQIIYNLGVNILPITIKHGIYKTICGSTPELNDSVFVCTRSSSLHTSPSRPNMHKVASIYDGTYLKLREGTIDFNITNVADIPDLIEFAEAWPNITAFVIRVFRPLYGKTDAGCNRVIRMLDCQERRMSADCHTRSHFSVPITSKKLIDVYYG